jgi:hypothetical protein
MVATAKYHNAEDAALRIFPVVAPMCIDTINDVRSSALQVRWDMTYMRLDIDEVGHT